jgi:hypothetical protein
MDNGTDEDNIRAERMDEWISVGGGGEGRASGANLITFSSLFLHFVRRTHTPRLATLRVTDFICRGPRPVSFISLTSYISPRDERLLTRIK